MKEMTNFMNDYYYDNSSGPTVSTFTVEYSKARAGLIIAFMIFPFLPVLFFRDLFSDLYASGATSAVYMFVSVIIIIFLLFLFVFFESVGKKIEVLGNSITIRRWFFINETILLNNVSKCEIITGLVMHTRYGSRRYNKIVVHYNLSNSSKKNNTVSFTDDVYSNWQKLADYMTYNGKAVNIDGTSKVTRYFENLFKK